jgi:hypothetical protein
MSGFERVRFFPYIIPSLTGTDGIRGSFMEKEDVQLKELFHNYENLEDENRDKLLLVGKKLLSIEGLVKDKTVSSDRKSVV